ncbi:TetR family transcriptional regulator [Nocardioides cynanchi]|uniref:TetR/AcrR family transcriptional regulator n=1 Tax=Nocardioides cynanchi TaxID=2558918 RepID=UPI001EE3137F|nr:TetR family transcriptional regulator [Nocardioides cynanchi]
MILAAARTSFADKGFAGTTIRGIAALAGVDAALVHHYFGTKDDLFVAALELPVDPRVAIAPALADGADGAGERVLRVFIGVWDDPANTPVFVALARTLLDPTAGHLMRDGFLPVVLLPVGRALALDRPELRMSLVASQMLGIILSRYVLELEPIASMPADALVAAYAPTVQRYLTGDLP